MEGKIIFGFIFAICLFYLCKCYRVNGFRTVSLTEQQELVRNRRVVWHLSILFFLLGALRNMHTGVDTIAYSRRYDGTFDLGYTIPGLWHDVLFLPLSEKGYYLCAKCFALLFPSVQIWFAFLCLLFLIPCAILIYKYSSFPPLSFTYLLTMPILVFTWQGLRQSMAMSICLTAFFFAKEKKWLRFAVLLYLAFLFHRSSIIFLLIVPAMYFDADRKLFLGILVSVLLVLFNPLSIASFLLEHFGEIEKIRGYATSVSSVKPLYKMFLLLIIFFMVSYFVKDELIKQNRLNKVFMILAAIGCAMQLFSAIIAEFFRVSFYFNIFNMLLVPNACQVLEKKYPNFPVSFCAWLLLVGACYMMGVFNYWFCWEDGPWFSQFLFQT